ncbi:MAG: hypothetical protein ABI782_08280 [Anaerolineaceae bacterium]
MPSGAVAPASAFRGGSWTAQLTWKTVVAAGGFVLALIGSFTTWVTAGGEGFGAFEEDARFRIGDWLDTSSFPIDGLVVLALACGGLAAVWATAAGRIPERRGTWLVGELGAPLAILGVLQMQYISSVGGSGVGWGFGLYLVVAGGAMAALSPFAPARPVRAQH